jgi:hypothetical protein
MSGHNGEVAIKREGHVHAVAAPELSGPIRVDVDSEHVELPPGAHVSFADENTDPEAETDGGAVPTRSEVAMRGGLALDREPALWCSVLSALGFMAAGYLWGRGGDDVLVAAILGAAAVALGYYGTGSFWRWRGAGE